MRHVYFDNAATTPLRQEVISRITKVMKERYGNASSAHSFGRSSKSIIEQSRKTIARQLNVTASEIIFTSGGTEADNLVLQSAVKDLEVKQIITTRIEHHAVLHTVQKLEKDYGLTVSYVNVDSYGSIDYEELETLLSSEEKTLVSLMHINNEIGNILDLKRVANLCQLNNALFHSDAVQSFGHYELDLQDIPIDFIAASAHKFHGPKGVGFVFIRKKSGLKPSIIGGEQERGLRAGTEAIHNIAGMEEAVKFAYANLETERNYIASLKAYFIDKLTTTFKGIEFNGLSSNMDKSSYTLLNVCLPIALEKALVLLFQLDLKGIACSKGSACQSGSSKGSHVLSEILTKKNQLKPSIRFSFSKYNTKEEIDYVINVLKEFL